MRVRGEVGSLPWLIRLIRHAKTWRMGLIPVPSQGPRALLLFHATCTRSSSAREEWDLPLLWAGSSSSMHLSMVSLPQELDLDAGNQHILMAIHSCFIFWQIGSSRLYVFVQSSTQSNLSKNQIIQTDTKLPIRKIYKISQDIRLRWYFQIY